MSMFSHLPIRASVYVASAILILAHAAGGQRITQVIISGRIDVLAPSATLFGALGARVGLRSTPGDRRSLPYFSDGSGLFYINGVPSGEYLLEVATLDAREPLWACSLLVQGTSSRDVAPIQIRPSTGRPRARVSPPNQYVARPSMTNSTVPNYEVLQATARPDSVDIPTIGRGARGLLAPPKSSSSVDAS